MASMLQNAKIKSLVDKLWNLFWSGGISNPLTAIEQISYLIFMKRIDDLDLDKVSNAEFTGEPYNSRFEGEYKLPGMFDEKGNPVKIDKQTLRWSHFKQMPKAEEMLLHVQTKVFPFIKDLNNVTVDEALENLKNEGINEKVIKALKLLLSDNLTKNDFEKSLYKLDVSDVEKELGKIKK